MSRSVAVIMAICVAAAGAGGAARAQAFSDEAAAEPRSDAELQAMIDAARARTSAIRKRDCGSAAPGEIVVCAPDETPRFRIPSTSESNPRSPQALNDGVPRAPDFSGGSCKGEAGCIGFGWAPPPIYIIDMKAIPEPPPGSDADKIAKGEMAAP